jgi:transposase
MKSRQRRSFSAEMKARIALEANKEQKTIQEIASHYGVHPSQVTNWKRQAIQGAPELFANRRSQPDTSEEALKAELYQQIGQLQVELDWLKKKSGLSPEDRSARPRLGQRYHLHSPATGLCLSGGDHGLVQPLCVGVGGIDFVGERLLRGGIGLGIDNDAAGDFQYRPRGAVHQRGIYEPSRGAGHYDQHGRARTSDRQHFHRTIMADGEIRRGFPPKYVLVVCDCSL